MRPVTKLLKYRYLINFLNQFFDRYNNISKFINIRTEKTYQNIIREMTKKDFPALFQKMVIYFSYVYRLRVCASFPILMEISDKKGLTLTEEKIKEGK
jgi:hypothetical protein